MKCICKNHGNSGCPQLAEKELCSQCNQEFQAGVEYEIVVLPTTHLIIKE